MPWKIECYVDAKGNNLVEEFITRSPSVTVHPLGRELISSQRLAIVLGRLSRKALQTAEKASYPSLRSIASLRRTGLYASVRRFFARLASEIFLSSLQKRHFDQKSQKTPRREMEIAQKRMEEV